MQLTMSSLCCQMDTSLTKRPGKALTSKKRLVEQKTTVTETLLSPTTVLHIHSIYPLCSYIFNINHI